MWDHQITHLFTRQHGNYHKPGDDSEKLNYEGMKLIKEYIASLIVGLNDKEKLVFTKTKYESTVVPSFKLV